MYMISPLVAVTLVASFKRWESLIFLKIEICPVHNFATRSRLERSVGNRTEV